MSTISKNAVRKARRLAEEAKRMAEGFCRIIKLATPAETAATKVQVEAERLRKATVRRNLKAEARRAAQKAALYVAEAAWFHALTIDGRVASATNNKSFSLKDFVVKAGLRFATLTFSAAKHVYNVLCKSTANAAEWLVSATGLFSKDDAQVVQKANYWALR